MAIFNCCRFINSPAALRGGATRAQSLRSLDLEGIDWESCSSGPFDRSTTVVFRLDLDRTTSQRLPFDHLDTPLELSSQELSKEKGIFGKPSIAARRLALNLSRLSTFSQRKHHGGGHLQSSVQTISLAGSPVEPLDSYSSCRRSYMSGYICLVHRSPRAAASWDPMVSALMCSISTVY